MPITPNNLGWVKSVFKGITPPSNTDMLWFDDNVGVKKHKYYDTQSSTWKLFQNTLFFDTFSNFPPSGLADFLYIDKGGKKTYIYDTLSGYVLVGGGGGGVTERSRISDVTCGAIKPLDEVGVGLTLDDALDLLLIKIFEPTFTTPSLSANLIDVNLEAGGNTNFVCDVILNRGSILGAKVGGIWDANAYQNPRAGAATNYNINSVDNGTNNSLIIVGKQTVDGTNTIPITVTHAIGVQPLNSKDQNFNTPYPAGSISINKTYVGYRKLFHGTTTSNVALTTSAQVRALPSSVLNPQNGSTFTINIPIGAKQVVFAYPATLQDVSSVKYVEFSNTEIKGNFTKYTFNVEGANGYSPISYKVYIMIPDATFDATATYNVTI